MNKSIFKLKNIEIIKIIFIIFLGFFHGYIYFIDAGNNCGDAKTYLSTEYYDFFGEKDRTEYFFIGINTLFKKLFYRDESTNNLVFSLFTTYYFYISNILFYLILRLQNIPNNISLTILSISGISYSVFIGSCQYPRQYISVLLSYLLIFSLNKENRKKKDSFIDLIIFSIIILTHSGISISLTLSYLIFYLVKKFLNIIFSLKFNILRLIRNIFIIISGVFILYFFGGSYLSPIFTYFNYGFVHFGNHSAYELVKPGIYSFLIYLISFLIIFKWSILISKLSAESSKIIQIRKTIFSFIIISIIIFSISYFIFPYLYRSLVLKNIWLLISLGLIIEYEKENIKPIDGKSIKILYQYRRLSYLSIGVSVIINWLNLSFY